MENGYKLYTYCAMDGVHNLVQEIESCEIGNWKNNYIEDMKQGYFSSDQSIDCRKLYCDPDQTYQKGYNHHFFEQQVRFLNKREAELKNKLNGAFYYEFEEGEGIAVYSIDKGKKTKQFYLRSDQFCFSAPSNEKSHPYDLYIDKMTDKNAAIEKVANWIISSRTIGGSFLWPTPFYFQYNPQRGGKITSNRRFYIQDRVDLTLWELYYRYNDANKSTIMKKCDKQDSNLGCWLSHFKDFITYTCFFCFEDFLEMIGEDLCPISIISGKIHEPKWGEKGQNPAIEITNNMDFKTIQEMLERVNKATLNRSISIAGKL